MANSVDRFRRYLDRCAVRVDRTLETLLPRVTARPTVIHRAMRYTTLAEGKRLRPALVILGYEATGGRGRKADPVAAAVEIVHAFSLIHDDLPAMDDDTMRRGKPSSHIAFGEGVAILAGDALLTLAFQVLGEVGRPRALGPRVATALVAELSAATGSQGVIGGQVLDLLSEGTPATRQTLDYIHRHKTARLFASALRLGALAAEAPKARVERLARYGDAAGTAFQIVDDILGAAGSFRELGREPGRDQARGKVTYPRIRGFKASHAAVDRLLRQAGRETARFPEHRDLFDGFLELLDQRRRDAAGHLLMPGGKR